MNIETATVVVNYPEVDTVADKAFRAKVRELVAKGVLKFVEAVVDMDSGNVADVYAKVK